MRGGQWKILAGGVSTKYGLRIPYMVYGKLGKLENCYVILNNDRD